MCEGSPYRRRNVASERGSYSRTECGVSGHSQSQHTVKFRHQFYGFRTIRDLPQRADHRACTTEQKGSGEAKLLGGLVTAYSADITGGQDYHWSRSKSISPNSLQTQALAQVQQRTEGLLVVNLSMADQMDNRDISDEIDYLDAWLV
jgi:hypothetical protein